MVVLSASIAPQHHKWLQDTAATQANRLDADVSVSAVVRACIRYTANAIKTGDLTTDQLNELTR